VLTFENFDGDLLIAVKAGKNATERSLANLGAEGDETRIDFPVVQSHIRQLLLVLGGTQQTQ